MYGTRHAKIANLPKGELRQLRQLRHFLWPYRGRLVLAGISVLLGAAMVLALGHAIKTFVDAGIDQTNVAMLDGSYMMFLAVIVVLGVITYLRLLLIGWLGERMVLDIRSAIYDKITQMHVGFFETTRTGDLLSRMTTDTVVLQSVMSNALPVAIRNSVLMFGTLIMLLITSPQLTMYFFLLMPLVIIPILLLGKRVRQLSRESQARVADMHSHAEESISYIRTIQSMTLEPLMQGRFSDFAGDANRTAVRRLRLRALLVGLVIMLTFGAVVTVLWIGGHAVISGALTPGELSAFIFYSILLASSVGSVSDVVADLQRAGGAAERLVELLALNTQIASPDKPKPLPDCRSSEICFENVTFHYPSRPEDHAVSGISLSIKPGEIIALVGASGAGKTTLFQLLLRNYDPSEGRITYGNVDLRDLSLQDYRSRIGLVPQEPVIFSADAMENIRFGNVEASEEEIMAAAKAAHAHEFITALPQSYQTHLGEKGVSLSGGQRQRLAIARAIVRDPAILLLDEATSSLDSESEDLVQQGLEKLMKNRTTLVIAHRLSTVRGASRVVVMAGGKIEDIGSHDSLLESSITYRRYFELQRLKG